MGTGQTKAAATLLERQAAALLDVQTVAAMYGCSARHVYRLTDCGKMPGPVHLGALARRRRAEVEKWIADGCPPVRRRAAS